jgi:hypothetical protein
MVKLLVFVAAFICLFANDQTKTKIVPIYIRKVVIVIKSKTRVVKDENNDDKGDDSDSPSDSSSYTILSDLNYDSDKSCEEYKNEGPE